MQIGTSRKRQSIIYTIGATVLFLLLGYIFRNQTNLSSSTFLSLHIVLELFSIIVSFMIAIQGWFTYLYTKSIHRLRIGALFLSVGLLDVAHTLSYEGMPLFLTHNSPAKATWFWLLARLVQAVGFLYMYLFNREKNVQLFGRIRVYSYPALFAIILIVIISYFSESLPILVIEGEGVTSLKRGIEFIICILLMVTLFLVWRQYRKSRNPNLLYLFAAFALLLISELLFTVYASVYDTFNLIGHIFKSVGYLFLLKGIYFSEGEQFFLKQQHIEKQLDQERLSLQTISWNLGEGVLVTDRQKRVTFMNPEAERLLGWRKEELLYQPLYEILSQHQSSRNLLGLFTTDEFGIKKHEAIITQKNGSSLVLSCTITPLVYEDKIIGSVALLLDKTNEKQQQQMIEKQAFYDDLTGLPNQRMINMKLEDYISEERQLSLILLNLDRFKRINDSLGPEIGDKIIRAIGQRLRETIDEGNYLSRNRGDEFAFILPNVISEEEISAQCEKILSVFERPIKVDNYEVIVHTSIGVSIFPLHANQIDELIKKAYVALYSSKQQNNHFLIYNPYMDNRAYEGLMLENHLYQALMNEEFLLVYQPQIDICSGKIIGVEALIRWNHPEKGMISPAEFIPIAEVSGLIVPLGEWILRTSLRDLKQLHDLGHTDLTMSVNLSMRQFYDERLFDKIKAIVEEANVPPHQLVLELTESVMMNTESTLAILQGLKDLGIKISIDDFGTGYSSLAYLKRLPIDELKIDKSFIHDISSGQSDVAIVSTILSIAKHLQLKVVAEGVETYEQLQHLRSLEKDIMIQGYLVSKPLTLPELQAKWEQLSINIQ